MYACVYVYVFIYDIVCYWNQIHFKTLYYNSCHLLITKNDFPHQTKEAFY